MKKLFTVLMLLCCVVAWGQNVDRVNVVIDDAKMNDALGQGRVIGYVAVVLKEQVLLSPDVRLLDLETWKRNLNSALQPKYLSEMGKTAARRFRFGVLDCVRTLAGQPLSGRRAEK